MHYEFPKIQHIDDVIPHIDEDCFRVKVGDCGNTYINYVKMGSETFPEMVEGCGIWGNDAAPWNLRAAIRRECRGIAFNTKTGLIVSRPFHKFFNVEERADMTVAECRFDLPHVVFDKVDGSMLRPIPTEYGLRWGTKMGVTDTAMLAETWLADKPKYEKMAEYLSHVLGLTPLFEYVSPENRIVVDYGERNMILLAVRDNYTGTYISLDALRGLGDRWDIPVVKTYDPVDGDPTVYLTAVKDSTDLDEGVVVAWESGSRAKIKTETYSILHKVKEAGRTERTLITAILDGKVDDLLPLLSEKDRAEVAGFVGAFWTSFARLEEDIAHLYVWARESYLTKKDFAVGTSALTQIERATVFSLWDGKVSTSHEAAERIVTNGLSSEKKWAETKENIMCAYGFTDFAATWKGTEVTE